MMVRVAMYLRSSKDRHDVSVDSQRREILAQIEADSAVLVKEYVDKVESAKTDRRPAFQEMMADLRRTPDIFKRLYCYDTSRFSRNEFHTKIYKYELKKAGVDIVYLKLPQENLPRSGRIMMVGMHETWDATWSEKSKEEGLRGMAENVHQGYRAGGTALFGYMLRRHKVGINKNGPIYKSTLEPDPVNFKKAQEYLRGRLQGEPRKALAKRLGIDISTARLLYMERSALVYAGFLIWNRHNEKVDGQYVGGERERPESEWHVVPKAHPAAITESEARTIMAMTKKRSLGTRNRESGYALSGILKCSCGGNLVGDAGYYRCFGRCGGPKVKQKRIESTVLNGILETVLTDGVMTEIIGEVNKLAQSTGEHAREAKAIQKEIGAIRRQQDKLTDLLVEVRNQRPILDKIDALEDRRMALEGRLEEIRPVESRKLAADKSLLGKFLVDYSNNVKAADAGGKKALLNTFIDHMEFTGDEVKIFPALHSKTGLKVTSPRRFELLLPP